jgi:aspartate/methionine/tyrosine aminotransferase
MELLAQARRAEAAGRDIVHMEIGEPDFPTPEPVIAAARQALENGRTHYTAAAGLESLRTAIAAHYLRSHGVRLDPSRVLVTPGSSGALQLAMCALLDPGDRILMTDPGYPCNRHIAGALAAEAVALPVGPATAYQPPASQVRDAWTANTRALLLASPSNPTGSVLDRGSLRQLHEVVAVQGGWLVMDEIYHGLVYGADAPSALEASDRCFVINSFSKYFGMTGFRIGWLVAPEAFVPAVERLAQNLFLAANTPGQHAALAALAPETLEILERRRAEFGKRRDFLLSAVRELGFEVPRVPDGAFYIYADASRHTDDSQRFSADVLEQADVVLTPGTDFGSHDTACHVRFAYTTGLDRLQEGVERLRRYLRAGA